MRDPRVTSLRRVANSFGCASSTTQWPSASERAPAASGSAGCRHRRGRTSAWSRFRGCSRGSAAPAECWRSATRSPRRRISRRWFVPVVELVGVDLATRDVEGMESVEADVRELPFDGSLVRPGSARLDARARRGRQHRLRARRPRPTGMRACRLFASCAECSAGDGSVLVTVPLGEPGDHGWFRQEDERGWNRLFARAGFFVEEQEAYELTPDGWRAAPDFQRGGCSLRRARPRRLGSALLGASTRTPAPAHDAGRPGEDGAPEDETAPASGAECRPRQCLVPVAGVNS